MSCVTNYGLCVLGLWALDFGWSQLPDPLPKRQGLGTGLNEEGKNANMAMI